MIFDKVILTGENLFDSYADAIVLPRSTVGTVAEGIRSGVFEHLKIELPERLPYKALGTLDITHHTNVRNNNLKPIFFVLMATCVDNNNSTYDSIEEIALEIARFTRRYPEIRDVATPLIGTGAGGLDHVRVYEILAKAFIQGSAEKCRLFIHVLDKNVYPIVRLKERELFESFDFGHTEKLSQIDNDFFKVYPAEREFYLAGASWGSDDQTERFFLNNIWENGYDNRFIELIKRIKVGSVIILKSTYASGNTGYLRIKGAGAVIENMDDGRLLKVDWRV